MAVPGHHRGPKGLDCRAVVVGPHVDGGVRGVRMPAAVLGHVRNLGEQRHL